MRDPRDIIVSAYFSNKQSHPLMGPKMAQIRKMLNSISITDGLIYMIQQRDDDGHFAALRSWVDSSKRDEDILLLKFEDLIGPERFQFFRELFLHCDIRMPEEKLSQLLQDYSFEQLSRRKRGEEDPSAHYRKGVAGDWKNYFNNAIITRFKGITGDLVAHLGYEEEF